MIFLLFAVPLPSLEISGSHSDAYLAGMPAELRCTINLDDAIDTAVGIAVKWQVDGMDLSGTLRSRTLESVLVGDSSYDSILQFDTLSSTSDSGNYMCTATLYPVEAMSYITNTTGTAAYMFTVIGV